MNNTPYTSPAELQRQKLSRAAIQRVSLAWLGKQPGAVPPALNASVDAAAASLDRVWLDCRDGKADITAFKRALSAWETANIAAARGKK